MPLLKRWQKILRGDGSDYLIKWLGCSNNYRSVYRGSLFFNSFFSSFLPVISWFSLMPSHYPNYDYNRLLLLCQNILSALSLHTWYRFKCSCLNALLTTLHRMDSTYSCIVRYSLVHSTASQISFIGIASSWFLPYFLITIFLPNIFFKFYVFI